MNLIQRICEKYPIEYTLMPDYRIRTVNLTFGAQIPADLCDEILDGLDRLGVYAEDTGLPMALDVSDIRENSYTLTLSGQEMFHFSHFSGISFPGYQISEAIIWAVYIMASRKDWLDPYKGKFISCRCFSARQQATAIQISNSVDCQFQANISDSFVRKVFQDLGTLVSSFAKKAPRFSARPIEETVFEKYKGRSENVSLQELSCRIFGSSSFEDELNAYCHMVKHSSAYVNQVEFAARKLTETAYNLPIMAVSHLFTELGSLIDCVDHADFLPVSVRQTLLTEKVRFSLNATSLASCFSKLDEAYLDGICRKLQVLFLREVSEKAHTLINLELANARRSITQLRNALGHFCFIRQRSIDQSGSDTSINWKKLSVLEDRDIYSTNLSWTPESFNDLQSTIKSIYAPQLWICSEILRNQSQVQSITDLLITKSAPVMDERLVWAIWVDV